MRQGARSRITKFGHVEARCVWARNRVAEINWDINFDDTVTFIESSPKYEPKRPYFQQFRAQTPKRQ